jgi:hypothetical protein
MRPLLDENGKQQILHQFLIPDHITRENAETVRLDMLKDQNLIAASRSVFNREGQNEFNRRVLNAGININNYFETDKAKELSDIYFEVGSNPQNMQDTEEARLHRDMLVQMLSVSPAHIHQIFTEQGISGVVSFVQQMAEEAASIQIGDVQNSLNEMNFGDLDDEED